MSLQNLAQNVQQAGRGNDSVLVHMTPQEVGGLQALAMANGGSLSINPETGLPEAGFLSKILPMVAGALLAPMTAGTSLAFLASSPMATALTVGGLTGLATGSLSKGFQAGLGAFGGAGLSQGLTAAGAANAANAANAGTATTAANAIQQAPVFAPGSTGALEAAKSGIIGANPAGVMTATGPSSAYTGGFSTVQTPVATQLASKFPANQFASSTATQMPSGFDALKGGFKAIGNDPVAGMKSVWENMPTGTGIASIATLANAAQPDYKPPKKTKSFIRPYRMTRNYESSGHGDTGYGTSERRYFDDELVALEPYEAPGPEYAARGGLLALADGGEVDEMTRMSALSGNEDFPMARQKTPAYAIPAERAIPEQVLTPAVDRYTGEVQGFDDGGYVRYTGTRPLNEDTDDYYYVPGTSAGSGYHMIREGTQGGGFNSASFGKPGYEMAKDSEQGSAPYAFDYDRATGKFIQKAGPGMPSTKLSNNPKAYNADMLNAVYQNYFGRDVDPEGIAAYTARDFAPSELDTLLKMSPEYAARQQQLAAAKKEASYATATQAANAFEDVLGRNIDPEALKFYTQEQRMTPAELKKTLMQSEEYLTKLTKPFVPVPQTNQQTGQVSIEGALRTPQQEAARPQDMSNFYSMMDQRLAAQRGFAGGGGVYDLGGYSDGGRLLRGPGDGVSDSIPAVIGNRQPARLADGEFVIPARIVSELGNGSTEAGARKLYAMMDRVQKSRRKTVGKNKVAANTKADKHLPA